MRKKQANPLKHVRKTKTYNKESLYKAYEAVKQEKMPTERAARLYGVPAQTLRDRVLGKVRINSSCGRASLFTTEEEEALVNHLEDMAKIGYGLNRSQLNVLATELATKLGKLSEGKSLSNRWYYAFLKRWDNRLKVIKPRALSSTRASSLTPEVISAYFADLNNVLEINELKRKPHLIYNLDETGIQPEHKPAKVIAGKSCKVQAVTSPNSTTTTLIACVNAAGTALPPFYVFKGKLRNDELLKGGVPNSDYEMSESGWSNGQVLMKYLKNHFLKYVQKGAGDNNDPLLLIYDGHASHVNLDLMKWALANNIILFVLPPHASHALQPLDVGCFAPFKACYYHECNQFMAKQRGQIISRYDIAALSGKAYLKAMTPVNITSSFRKCGIYPFDESVVPDELLLPSKSFQKKTKETEEQVPTFQELLTNKIIETGPKISSPKKQQYKRPRLGGKCITEDVVQEVEDWQNNIKKKTTSRKSTVCRKTKPRHVSPEPSTSNGQKACRKLQFDVHGSASESEYEEDDEEKCCECGKFSPPGLRECNDIIIVKWAECTKCGHWCHLRFCSEVRVVRRHGDFLCPHCC